MSAIEEDAITNHSRASIFNYSIHHSKSSARLREALQFLSRVVSFDWTRRTAKAQAMFLPYALATVMLCVVGLAGHQIGRRQEMWALPVQSLVDDFESGLKSPVPLDYVSPDSGDAKATAHWLSRQVGHKVLLPAPGKSGTRILGARRHELWGRAVAQAHYIKNGVHIALYQIHEPRAGLRDMQEAEFKGRTYLAARRGNYHVVVWRKGDDIVTMVSPLERVASLRLAAALRDASPDSDASPDI
jgi:hypothetical protein